MGAEGAAAGLIDQGLVPIDGLTDAAGGEPVGSALAPGDAGITGNAASLLKTLDCCPKKRVSSPTTSSQRDMSSCLFSKVFQNHFLFLNDFSPMFL